MQHLMRILLLAVSSSTLHVACTTTGNNAERTPSPTSSAATTVNLPDMSRAQDYVVYHSNIRLIQAGGGKFNFDPTLLKVVGNIVSVTVGTPNAGTITADQRAHTAMKAAFDIQRATGAEGVLLYVSLGEGLPKLSYSVAMAAYAPAGMDWKDGAGARVWDVEVSDVRVEQEAIRLAQLEKRAGSSMALPIPVIYRKDYVPGNSSLAGREKSLDEQLFELLNDSIVSDQIEHPYRVEAARGLIEQGVNVNARDHGQTLLMRAAQNGHPQIMKLLLNHGADVNAQADDGRTALMIAAGLTDTGMVRLLLERGAKVNIKDHDGFTVWTGSEMVGGSSDPDYLEMRRLLKKAGAK